MSTEFIVNDTEAPEVLEYYHSREIQDSILYAEFQEAARAQRDGDREIADDIVFAGLQEAEYGPEGADDSAEGSAEDSTEDASGEDEPAEGDERQQTPTAQTHPGSTKTLACSSHKLARQARPAGQARRDRTSPSSPDSSRKFKKSCL